MRERQAGRVYQAERECRFWQDGPQMTWDEVNRLVDRILKAGWVRDRYNKPKVTRHNMGFRSIAARGGGWAGERFVKLPNWAWNKHVVCHEVAHSLETKDKHGSDFAWCYLRLVREFMGWWEGQELATAFKRNLVKVA